jgi:DNA-binding transcriptional LysR family regulator
MNSSDFEGEVRLGVPHDIVHPHIPRVLQRLAAEFPRMKVQLCSSFTTLLKEELARGELDLILTTEVGGDAGAELLETTPLVWIGAPGGQAHRSRPVRLAFLTHCMFRRYAQGSLDEAGISWENAVQSDSDTTIEATVAADLAVAARLKSAARDYHVILEPGSLPELPVFNINMYRGRTVSPVLDHLAGLIRAAYGQMRVIAAE